MKALAVILLTTFSISALAAEPNPLFAIWSAIKTPSHTPTKIYGEYAAGCIDGAQPLPLDGEGYLVLRNSRNRFYGHPNLVSYLKSLGAKAKAAGLPKLMYGDMSAPRGGPFLVGHSSHQTGLDVDISYSFALKSMTPQQRDSFVDPVLVIERKKVSEKWTSNQSKLVELAASSPEVARVFVAPGIKRELCRLQPDAKWLYKLRSWWGHDDHLHVRLDCPQDQPTCERQAPLDPDDNGCGADLTSWLSKKADATQAAMDDFWKQPNHPSRSFPNLPSACKDVRSKQ